MCGDPLAFRKMLPWRFAIPGASVAEVARQENATLILDWAERERANFAVTVGQTSCLAEREMTIRVVFLELFNRHRLFRVIYGAGEERAIRKLHWPAVRKGEQMKLWAAIAEQVPEIIQALVLKAKKGEAAALCQVFSGARLAPPLRSFGSITEKGKAFWRR